MYVSYCSTRLFLLQMLFVVVTNVWMLLFKKLKWRNPNCKLKTQFGLMSFRLLCKKYSPNHKKSATYFGKINFGSRPEGPHGAADRHNKGGPKTTPRCSITSRTPGTNPPPVIWIPPPPEMTERFWGWTVSFVERVKRSVWHDRRKHELNTTAENDCTERRH